MPGSSGPAPPGGARRLVALLGGIARVDVHRPAAWLAAAMAAAAPAWGGPSGGPPLTAAAIVVGGCSAVAAIGAPPRIGRLGGRPTPAWWVARAAWPALGVWLAAAACGRPIVATAVTAAVLAAAALSYAAAAPGAPAALAASTALVPVLAAAAGSIPGGGTGAVLAGALAAGLVLAVGRRGAAAEVEEGPPSSAGTDPVAPSAPLLALALVSSLATMAGCYFLDPRQAAWFTALAAAWLVALAVPEATLAAGAADGPARRRLVRGGAVVAWRSGLGDGRRSSLLVVRHAALLGWPAMVAAVLWGGAAARPGGPLTALAVLGLLAALIVLVVVVLAALGVGGETVLAATLGAVVFAMLAMMCRLPGLPGPAPSGWPVAASVRAAVLSGWGIPARLPSRRSPLWRGPGTGPVRDAAPMQSRNGVASNDT